MFGGNSLSLACRTLSGWNYTSADKAMFNLAFVNYVLPNTMWVGEL